MARPVFFSKKTILLACVFSTLILAPVLAGAASTELVSKGNSFANELFGPLFAFLAPLGFGVDSALTFIQFLAAFTMIFFLLQQMSPQTPQLAGFVITVLATGVINFFIRIDWYLFLIHFSPALLTFFLSMDVLGLFSFLKERTAKWVAFFSMIMVFFTDYAYFTEQGILGYFFSRIFGTSYAVVASPVVLIIAALFLTFTRMIGVLAGSMKTESARQYQLLAHKQAKLLEQAILQGTAGQQREKFREGGSV